MQHLPGVEAWLVGEWRASGERKYYLVKVALDADLKTLAATIKARWVCEQAHQQLKEELGLDHFEGRSWKGLHRHALMSMIAFAFLQHRRLAAASGGKKQSRQARLSRRSQPFENSSFSPWRARRPIDARIAEGAFEDCSYESAEVALIFDFGKETATPKKSPSISASSISAGSISSSRSASTPIAPTSLGRRSAINSRRTKRWSVARSLAIRWSLD
jgi:DDE family transposase